MHFVDTNTVILKKKKKYPLKCVCMYMYTGKTTLTANFLAIFYKSLNLCSTNQLTVEVIRNCNMPFSRKIDIYKNCILIYYEIRTRWTLFAFYRMKR